MCAQVQDGSVLYTTPRELADLVGGRDGLIWLQRPDEMDWCLCVIDLPSTLDRASLAWKQGDDPQFIIV